MCFSNIEWTILRKRNQNIKIPASSRQSLKKPPAPKMDALLSVVHIFLRKKIVAPHSIFSIARGPSVVRTIAATVFPAFHGKLGKLPPSPKVWPCRKIRWVFPVFKHTVLRLPLVCRNHIHHIFWNDPRFGCCWKFSRHTTQDKQVFFRYPSLSLHWSEKRLRPWEG